MSGCGRVPLQVVLGGRAVQQITRARDRAEPLVRGEGPVFGHWQHLAWRRASFEALGYHAHGIERGIAGDPPLRSQAADLKAVSELISRRHALASIDDPMHRAVGDDVENVRMPL